MKNGIGIIREIDKNGRVVIPKEMRERVFLNESVEILLTDNGVLVRNAEYDLVKVKREKDK